MKKLNKYRLYFVCYILFFFISGTIVLNILLSSFEHVNYKHRIEKCTIDFALMNRGAELIWCKDDRRLILPLTDDNGNDDIRYLRKRDVIWKDSNSINLKVERDYSLY